MFSYPPFIAIFALAFLSSFAPLIGEKILSQEDWDCAKQFFVVYYPIWTCILAFAAGVLGNKYARQRVCQKAREIYAAKNGVKVH